MRKGLAWTLVAMVLALLMAAPAAAEPATADEIAELTKDYVEISWYFPRPVGNMSSQASIEEYLIGYLKDSLNCALRMYPVDMGSYNEKVQTMCAAGEPFDMLFTAAGWVVDPINAVAQGYFYPVTELLPKYGPDILAKDDPRVWDAATFSGDIMFIPMQTPFAQGSSICFKADLFDKYKAQLGKDYKELTDLKSLEPYLALIKESEPDTTPLQSLVGAWNKTAWEIATGVYYYEETGKLGLSADDPATIANLKVMADYYKKGYIAKDNIVRTETKAEISTGKYAVFPDPGEYSEDGSKSSGMYGFRCYETLYGYPIIRTASMLSGTAISASSEHPERVMLLLNQIWKDRFLSNTIAYGLEGQDYSVVSGDIHDPTVDSVIQANSGDAQHWAIWHNWVGAAVGSVVVQLEHHRRPQGDAVEQPERHRQQHQRLRVQLRAGQDRDRRDFGGQDRV